MKEYIERAAVEKFIEGGLNSSDKNKAFGHDAIEIMAEIHYMPAADVVEVRHGRWFFTEYEFFTCSVCGESYYNGAESTAQAESYLNSGHTYKYCPNCGARMDKEDEHEAD